MLVARHRTCRDVRRAASAATRQACCRHPRCHTPTAATEAVKLNRMGSGHPPGHGFGQSNSSEQRSPSEAPSAPDPT